MGVRSRTTLLKGLVGSLAAVALVGCSSAGGAPTAPSPSAAAPSTQVSSLTPSPSASSSPTPTASATNTGSATSAPAATQTPSAGSTASTVPNGTQPTNKPTKLASAPSTVGTGVSAELSNLRTAYVKSRFPGEVSGNAVIFTVRVRNATSQPVDVSNVVVTVLGSDGSPASEITSAPARALSGSVRPGGSVTGTYVFTVPKSDRRPITVQVTISAKNSVAVFKGNVG